MSAPRVVLLCRDGAEAQYLADALSRTVGLAEIIVETGSAARRRKLDRMLQAGTAVHRVLRLIDVLAVVVYGQVVQRFLRRHVLGPDGVAGYPRDVARTVVDDANDPDCVARLRTVAPDVVVVLGTAILRDEVLGLGIPHILNVHGGVVPAYRNVHSDLWALLRRDARNVGTSILHLDAGIDTGDIALQARVDAQPGDSILALKRRNLELAAELAVQAVERAAVGTLPRIPQAGDPGHYPTPGVAQVARLLTARVS